MKKLIFYICALLATVEVSSVWAATTISEQSGNGLLIWMCIGFGVLVLLFQATPALIMFTGMLKGLFARTPADPSVSSLKKK